MSQTEARAGTLSRDAATFALLWFAGAYLRITIMAAPPLAPLIAADLGLTRTGVGLLTTLPTLLLAAVAIPGALVISRLGARRAVTYALLLIGAGSALRGAAPDAFLLFAATFAMGVGIAGMQPALPTLVRHWCPRRLALGTAVYTNGLLVGEVLSSSTTLPLILPAVDGSWRLSLVLWSLPAFIVAIGFAARRERAGTAELPSQLWWPDWRDRNVWLLGLMLGGTAGIYFGFNAYLPSLLHERGEPGLVAAALLALNGTQLVSSLLMLRIGSRLIGRRAPLAALALVNTVALAAGVIASGAASVAAIAVVGFCASMLLILLLSLPPLLGGHDRTPSLAAGMFAIGYACSFIVPLFGGLAWDISGIAATAFLPMALFSAVTVLLAGLLRMRDAGQP